MTHKLRMIWMVVLALAGLAGAVRAAEPPVTARVEGSEGASWSLPHAIAPSFSTLVSRSDPDGNVVALVLLPEGLAVVRSVGASGRWNPPEVIYQVSSNGYWYGQDMVIDREGNITVVWTQLRGAHRQLHARRYTPGAGWGSDMLILATTVFFDDVQAVADAVGNVVVVYDGEATSGGSEAGVWSIVYDAASQSFGPPTRISAAGDEAAGTAYLTMVASADGRFVAAMWMRNDGSVLTYLSTWFEPVTSTWAPPNPVPGVAPSVVSGGPRGRLPAAIDTAGTATFFLSAYAGRPKQTIVAVRGTSSGWQTPVRLLAPALIRLESDTMSYAVVTPDGSVHCAMTNMPTNQPAAAVAFSYARNTGWTSTVLEQTPRALPGARLVRSQAGVIAIYDSGTGLHAQVFDGSSWSRGPDPPPDVNHNPSAVVATTTTGNANVILYTKSLSTWYRP